MIRKYMFIFVLIALTFGVCMLSAQESGDVAVDIENVDTASAEAAGSSTNDSAITNVVRRVVLDKDFLEAEKLFFDKKYYIARRAFLKYLDEHPLSTNDMLYYYLASTYYIDKDYPNAIDYYKIALDLNPTPFYYNNVANSYYQMKSYPDALAWYRRSIGKIENAPKFEVVENIVETNYIHTNYVTNISILDVAIYKSLVDKYVDIESLSKNIDSQQSLTSVGDINATIDEASTANDSLDESTSDSVDMSESIETTATPAATPSTVPMVPSSLNAKDKMESISDILINRIENELFLSQTNIFVNTYYTNIATNDVSATNWTVQFGGVSSTGDSDEAATATTSNISSDSSSTLSPSNMSTAERNIYYSPYLHTANTYLKLGQYKEAQIYYEVFLTNVGGGYYQFDNISRMIDELKNIEVTNRIHLEQQIPLSMVTITNELDNSISTIYYSDGAQELVETVFEDGESSKLQKYKDGTIVNTRNYTDGRSIKESIYPNGKKEIETIDKDDNIVRTTFDIDSTRRIFSTNTTTQSQYSYIEYADGNNITKISDDNKNTTLIERLDASFTKYQLLADGTKEIYTLNTDGSELNRIEYPDGKVEISVKYPDGATVDKIDYADNTSKGVSKYPDGSVTFTSTEANGLTTITTTYIDGSTVSRIVNQGDTESPVMLTTSMYDEQKNFITTTVDADGAITTVTKSPDSTLKTEVVSADGTITTEIQKPTGFVDTKTTLPDGSTTSIVNTALGTTTETVSVDGTSKVEISDVEGNTKTTIKNIDKSTNIDIVNIDGSYEKMLLNEDGSGTIDALDKDGNSIKTIIYRNGVSKTVVEKQDGTSIDVIKSNNERNTVITLANGDVYRLSESMGRRAVLRAEIPDMLGSVNIDTASLETSEAIKAVETAVAEANASTKAQIPTILKTAVDYTDDYIMILGNIDTLDIVYSHEEEANKTLDALRQQLAEEKRIAEEEARAAAEAERKAEAERLEAERKAEEEARAQAEAERKAEMERLEAERKAQAERFEAAEAERKAESERIAEEGRQVRSLIDAIEQTPVEPSVEDIVE